MTIKRRVAAACGVVLFAAAAVFAVSERPSHLDRMKNSRGCAGCHRGHGKKGTAMLKASRREFCFTCHGMVDARPGVRARTDMASVFNKRSRHPIAETAVYHSNVEDLPERDPTFPRHVACEDCHRVHILARGATWKGVRGYTRGRIRGGKAEKEYEICYKCHSDSANLPADAANKREEFDVNNPSFHPVEAPGKNKRVPSLIRSLNVNSTITCTDCHGNDDPSGPRGPHGSDYDFLLKMRYRTTEGAETPDAYELCYACHDRRSIIENESFQGHGRHVVFERIPCSGCHTPHGSPTNPNLIEFDRTFVDVIPPPVYAPASPGRPMCFLNCHVGARPSVRHDNNFYMLRNWM